MAITIIQGVLAILLSAAILMQTKGVGLGAGFGGDGNVFRTKRGIEKKLVTVTVALAILFFGSAIANILVG
jgi:protein translocase SecG subunit